MFVVIKVITKEQLKKYGLKLLFEMKEEEYEVLEEEFKVILQQMDLISKIDGIEKVEPMTFPYFLERTTFREDKIENTVSTEEFLSNVSVQKENQVKVPKVVE